MLIPYGLKSLFLVPQRLKAPKSLDPAKKSRTLYSLYVSFWLRVKGYGTFWPQAKGYTTFQPGAKGYATFRSKAEGQGEPGRLPSAGLEPEAISVPYPRYPMRPEGPMWAPKRPTMGMGGRGGVGWGAPKAPIGLINQTATSTRSSETVMRQPGRINKGRRGEGEAMYNTRHPDNYLANYLDKVMSAIVR